MKQWFELALHEPTDDMRRHNGTAAVLADAALEEFGIALGPDECRALAKRLVELANDHEQRFPAARS